MNNNIKMATLDQDLVKQLILVANSLRKIAIRLEKTAAGVKPEYIDIEEPITPRGKDDAIICSTCGKSKNKSFYIKNCGSCRDCRKTSAEQSASASEPPEKILCSSCKKGKGKTAYKKGETMCKACKNLLAKSTNAVDSE
jgi:hypothetical protein